MLSGVGRTHVPVCAQETGYFPDMENGISGLVVLLPHSGKGQKCREGSDSLGWLL